MVFPVPIDDSPQKGSKTAPITIVVFGDFQCPFCVRGFETLKLLEDRYKDDLRVVYKHFPLPGHSYAIHAARASYAALEQGKFWEFHDAVYERGARFSAEDLELIAMRLGLDMDKFTDAMSSQRYDERIQKDMELGVALGVSGTPTFFVNGRPLDGARSEFEFRMLIAEEFERVKELRAEGVPPEKLYDALTTR
jgi:protein-disulfide isomerase